jgi:hypothetical protein
MEDALAEVGCLFGGKDITESPVMMPVQKKKGER